MSDDRAVSFDELQELEPNPTATEFLFDMREYMKDMVGGEIQASIAYLETTQWIVEKNYDEMKNFIDGQSTYPEQPDDFLAVYKRLLHNYAASVYSLIVHTQNFNNKYGDDEFRDTYTSELVDRGLDEKSAFVRNIRHYIQKNEIPDILAPGAIGFEDDEPTTFSWNLALDTESVIDWDGWNSDAKRFLNSTGVGIFEVIDSDDSLDRPEDDRYIPLIEEVDAYQNEIGDFYGWYYSYTHDYFDSEISDYLRMVEEHDYLSDYVLNDVVRGNPYD